MSYVWESAKLLEEVGIPEATGDREELEKLGTVNVKPNEDEKWYFPKDMFCVEYLSRYCKELESVTGSLKEMMLDMVHFSLCIARKGV